MKPWALALGVSLALHLAIAAAFRGEPGPSAPAPKVEKRGDGFVSFTAVSLAQPTKQAAPPKSLAAPSRVTSAPGPSTSPQAAVPASAEVGAEEGGLAQPVASAAEVVEAGGGGEAPLPAAPSTEAASAVIALVHARLAAAADRCYPAAARRFQQRGTVQLSFCTDGNGGTASTSVTQSSGAELLDAAARGCVLEHATPFPPQASARCFSVPVRFGLGP